ncbi:MAG: hypothetical protein JW749_11340 [Sedimentisphaerales bacterium]|nr:hypothetical protein [Sedimentisphaerales bacterium]
MKKAVVLLSLTMMCRVALVRAGDANSPAVPQPQKTQVIILGTVHDLHYKNPHYSPSVLRDIILSLKPDAILNELPLSQVDPNGRPLFRDPNKNPEDWASDTVAAQLGLRQIPIDRPDREENRKKTNYYQRRKRAEKSLDKWMVEIAGKDPNCIDLKIFNTGSWAAEARDSVIYSMRPEIINSDIYDLVIRIKNEVWDEIGPHILTKYEWYETAASDWSFLAEEWKVRNKIMAENIINAAREYPGKRLVVITGAEHRHILRDLLKDNDAIELKEFWELSGPPSKQNSRQDDASSPAVPQSEKTQVLIIGTLHEWHYKNPHYGPSVLRDIILSLKPDAILNELALSMVDPNGRPKAGFRQPNNPSGPEEWIADEIATQLGIKQIPFDRPDRQEHFKKNNYFQRGERAEKLKDKWWAEISGKEPNCIDLKIFNIGVWADEALKAVVDSMRPEIINSDVFDLIVRIKKEVWYETVPQILAKYEGYETAASDWSFLAEQWKVRNKIMAENIIKAAKEYPGKRLVVLTGAEHRYILRDLLSKEQSIELKEYWEPNLRR